MIIQIHIQPPKPQFTPITQAEIEAAAKAAGWGQPGFSLPAVEPDSIEPKFCNWRDRS